MNRLAFRTALAATGANHFSVIDLDRFIDEAANEFNGEELWPWRLTGESGTTHLTPFAVVGLGPIESVSAATGAPVFPRPRHELIAAEVDMGEVGAPHFYYVYGSALYTWPTQATAITVAHYTVFGWTTGGASAAGDADTPIAPLRYHDAILLLARMRASSVDRDWEALKVLRGQYELRLAQAREAELYDLNTEPRPRAAA